jgi:alcohol dehydrogenase (NADP+)
VGSNIGSIQDIKDMLEVASKKNVRAVIQKLPMAKVNEGIKMVRDGSVRYRVVLEN